MKKALKIIGIGIGSLVVIIGLFAAFIRFKPLPTYEVATNDLKVEITEARIEKGMALAQGICATCHMSENNKYEGRLLMEEPGMGTLRAPNITQHKTFGIGSYSDAELYHLFRTGIKRDGKLALPMMWKSIHMSNEDMYSLIAYLKSDHESVQPSDNLIPEFEQSFLTRMLFTVAWKPLPWDGQEVVAPEVSNTIEYGKYIVQGQLRCYDCHSASFETVNDVDPELTPHYMGGGASVVDIRTGELMVAPNVTMDKEEGIGSWSEEEFIAALKWGKKKDGTGVKWPMRPYTHLDTVEVRAVYKYLKTVPELNSEALAKAK